MTAEALLLTLVAISAIMVFGTAIAATLSRSSTPRAVGNVSLTPSTETATQREYRLREAKQVNEQLKLFAAYLNGLGIAVFIAVAIVPMAAPDAIFSVPRALVALVVSLVLHILGQSTLTAWKSET